MMRWISLRASVATACACMALGCAATTGDAVEAQAKVVERETTVPRLVARGDTYAGVGDMTRAEQYYATQPLELTKNRKLLEATFEAINAETNLRFSTDYPHWDFDLPSVIYDLPFVSEKGKHNILGGSAARLFKLPPRNDRQRDNMMKHGNLVG